MNGMHAREGLERERSRAGEMAQPFKSSDGSVTVGQKAPSRIMAVLGAKAFGKCISRMSRCCDQTPDKKQLKGESLFGLEV